MGSHLPGPILVVEPCSRADHVGPLTSWLALASRTGVVGAEAVLLGPRVAVAAFLWAPFLALDAQWDLLPWEVGSFPWGPWESSGASGVGSASGKFAHGPSGAASQLPSESALPFLLLQVGDLEGVAEQSEGGLEGSPGLLPYPGTQGQQPESWVSMGACCWEGWAGVERWAGAGVSVV